MNYTHPLMETINNLLDKNNKIREKLLGILSEREFSNGIKTTLLVAYLDIVREHQESILLLIHNKLCGSASALVRPVFDTFYKALWICGCASPQQIEKVSQNDDFEFPRDMIDVIDKKYATDGFFRSIKNASKKTMSSYIHSGLLPISRRFTGNIVQLNYEDEELKEIIEGTTIVMLLLARLVFMDNKMNDEAEKIGSILRSV